jgi:hypothetical protein
MTVNVLDNVFSKLFGDFVEISTEECQQQSSLFVFCSLAQNFMHKVLGLLKETRDSTTQTLLCGLLLLNDTCSFV